ncbi:hypothetical protein LJB89_02795 [Tyzzerella sp. OttesenSCG-928-J15]|nr:hypothetical protein [Tyzzerella sp. OttesenSCG-928-J15]
MNNIFIEILGEIKAICAMRNSQPCRKLHKMLIGIIRSGRYCALVKALDAGKEKALLESLTAVLDISYCMNRQQKQFQRICEIIYFYSKEMEQ